MTSFDDYRDVRVLVTGDTGFKGAWLSLWLQQLGAEVHGIGLAPEPGPALFDIFGLDRRIAHRELDIRDREELGRHVSDVRPEVIFHLAAQPLVRRSAQQPLMTLDTNVTGTANLLAGIEEAGYSEADPCSAVIVTSDKCYENCGADRLDETRPMGGRDIYSASKGMVELLVSAWRNSFGAAATRLATARAGNVIGGGDWAEHRIVPDVVRALCAGQPVRVRNPGAQRPWQHVLDALSGYLRLGAALRSQPDRIGELASGFNFGPRPESERTVAELVDALVTNWGSGEWSRVGASDGPPEAAALRLEIGKADRLLDWQPGWAFDESVARTVAWYRSGAVCDYDKSTMTDLAIRQIDSYPSLVMS